MSGKERGGRIRRGRQHLPPNSLTTTSPPFAFSAPPPFVSTSPAQRHEPTTYPYPPARQEYIAPPPFSDLAVPATVQAGILATSSDDFFGPPATASTTPAPAPVNRVQEEGKGKAEAKSDESAEEKAASTPKQSRRKKYKRRPGRSVRKPRRKTPRNARATCGNCKRPKNHMMTLSKPFKKEKEEEKGDGNDNWRSTDSDRESQICECDEDEEVRKAHKRNFYVEGETLESSEGTLEMWLSRRGDCNGWDE